MGNRSAGGGAVGGGGTTLVSTTTTDPGVTALTAGAGFRNRVTDALTAKSTPETSGAMRASARQQALNHSMAVEAALDGLDTALTNMRRRGERIPKSISIRTTVLSRSVNPGTGEFNPVGTGKTVNTMMRFGRKYVLVQSTQPNSDVRGFAGTRVMTWNGRARTPATTRDVFLNSNLDNIRSSSQIMAEIRWGD